MDVFHNITIGTNMANGFLIYYLLKIKLQFYSLILRNKIK